MKQQFDQVLADHVLAFISDSSIDFKLREGQTQLDEAQKEYLNHQLGFVVPKVININQVHGKDIVVIKGRPPENYQMQNADGIITNVDNLPIAIRTADCVPVFMYDELKDCIGLIHAGWKSTQQKIVQEAVSIMTKKFGSKPRYIKVAIGPCIRQDAFEVEEEFLNYFPNETTERNGNYYCDVVKANINQLVEVGVESHNIVDCQECTYMNKDYFSFRRDNDQAGRMLHLMMLRK